MAMDKSTMGLIAQANPQLARLLDQQEAQKAQQARMQPTNYGNDAMGRFLTAASGASRAMTEGGRNAANVVMGREAPVGPREQQALQALQTQQEITGVMSQPASQGVGRVQQLRDKASKLRATGNFNAIVMAEQLDAQADELAYKQGMLAVNSLKAQSNKQSSKGISSTEGEHFRDEQGNIFATVLTTNKDTGAVDVKYVNLTGGPEYDGTSKLVPVIKSGEFSGMSPLEAADLKAIREGDVELAKNFMGLKTEAAQNFSTAKSVHSGLIRVLEMTKQAAEQGLLEGGIQASLQNAYYQLFGKRPKTLAELNMLFGESTFQRLKPLFGGNISNGERESVQDLYMSVGKSGVTNVGILEQLIGKANGAMFNYNVLMTADSYKDWINKLVEDTKFSEGASNKPTVKRRRYNPETGTFEEIE